jgi:hypothetical protein
MYTVAVPWPHTPPVSPRPASGAHGPAPAPWRRALAPLTAVLVAVALVVALGSPAAWALPRDVGDPGDDPGDVPEEPGGPPEDPPEDTECLKNATGALSVWPPPRSIRPKQPAPQTKHIMLGETAFVSWTVAFPNTCAAPGGVTLNGRPVAPIGTLSVKPLADEPYFLGLGTRTLATTAVYVELPRVVRIMGSTAEWRRLLVQAISEPLSDPALAAVPRELWPGRTVLLASDVDLDLTGYQGIHIEQGVTLTSEVPSVVLAGNAPALLGRWGQDQGPVARDAHHLGPRLYTRSQPHPLFDITCNGVTDDGGIFGDNVRLTGFRLHGPHVDAPDGSDSLERGIMITACTGIEIANMELAGWSGQAVYVQDLAPDNPYMISPRIDRPEDVHIHDNFFHHNQHNPGGNGYGIDVKVGARALIERNVFDFNRHAIAAGSEPDTGYTAQHNLVLSGGGYHCWDSWANPWCNIDWQTHQFDVHGSDTCGLGHLNCGDAGEQFDILHNAFQYAAGYAIKIRGRPRRGVTIAANVFAHAGLEDDWGDDAIHLRTHENVTLGPGNGIDVHTYGEYGVCDFDSDGLDDLFLATGVSWWYASRGQMHWTYLNAAIERLPQVGLGDFDGDGRCDVFAVDRVAQQWKIAPGGSGAWTALPGTYDLPFEELGFGDFNGDGIQDIFHRAPDGQWWAISPGVYGWRPLQSSSFPLSKLRFGDFNNDRVTDVIAVQGSRWSVSWGGTTTWAELNPTLGASLEGLLLADINADGRDDVLRYTPSADGLTGTWAVSWGGRTGWAPLQGATLAWADTPEMRELRPADGVRWFIGRFNRWLGAVCFAGLLGHFAK